MVVFSRDCDHFGSDYPDSDNVRIYFKCAPQSEYFLHDLAQTNREVAGQAQANEVFEIVTDAEIVKCK